MAVYVNQKKLAAAIEARMKAMGMSRQKLADRTGVARSHISFFLSGTKQIGSDRLGLILKELRLTVMVGGRRRARERVAQANGTPLLPPQ